MAIFGALAIKLIIPVLLVELPRLTCFKFSKEPQSPVIVVLGHNTTNVNMEWKFETEGSTIANLKIKRFLKNQDGSLSSETNVVYFSPSLNLWNGTLYTFSASLSASGYANFTIKDVLKRIDNADKTKVSFLSGEVYTYRLDVDTFLPSMQSDTERSNIVDLHVYFPPTITVNGCQGCVNGSANESQTITLFCNATGKPLPNIRWTKNGEPYNVSSPGNTLFIPQVTREDKGNYTCIANNGVGIEDNKTIPILVKYKPDTPSLSPRQSDACENTSINFSCTADAYPPVTNYSLYDGDNYLGSSSSGQFRVTATPPGKNTFSCVATNEVGDSQREYADVYVLGVITPVCKINNETTSNATVNEGDEVVLQCNISGNESYYSYRWLEVKNSMSRNISSAIQLRFDSINRANEAQYQVTIKDKPNCFASQRRSFNVTVNYKPENTIMRLSSDKNVFCEGNSMQVNCTADGKPDPVYSLYRNDEYQRSNENGVFLVTFAVNGSYEYTCEPNNTAGVGPTKSQNVTVKGPLYSEMCTINNKNISHIQVNEMSLVDLRLVSSEVERLDFTWKNGTAIMGGKLSQNITIGSITRHEGGTYQVVARDRFNCSANVECNFTVDVHYFDQEKICGERTPELTARTGSQARNITVNTTGVGNPAFNVSCSADVNVYLSSSYKIEVNTLVPENKENIQFHCVFSNTVGSCSMTFVIWKSNESTFKSQNKVKLKSRNFTSDLKNSKSLVFINLANNIEKAFLDVYTKAEKEYVQAVTVNSFEKGSVWVNFELELIANAPNPIQPLQDAIRKNNGNIRGLIFEENSLSKGFQLPETTMRPTTTPISKTIESTTPTPPDDPTVIIIVVIVVVLVIIATAVVVIWCYCKRCNRKDSVLEVVVIAMNEEPGTNNKGFSHSYDADLGPQHTESANPTKNAKDKNDNQPQSGGEQGNPTYATVDKSRKPKKKTPGEPVYADLGDFVKNGDKAIGGHGGIVLESLPKDKVVKMPEKYEETVYATIVGTKKPTGENQNPAGGADDAPLEAAAVKATEAAEGAQKSGQAANPPKNEQKPSNDQQRQPLAKEDSADSIAKLNGRNETTLTTVSN